MNVRRRRSAVYAIVRAGGRQEKVAVGDVFELEGKGWRPVPDTLESNHRSFVFGVFPMQGQVLLGLRVDVICADQ